jgi:hypothetical protein
MKWIDKLYHAFLWFTGFAKGEHITDMLKRQKSRLKWLWWILSIGTVGFTVWLILHVNGVF